MKRFLILMSLVLAGCQAEQVTNSGPTQLSTAADFAPLFGKQLAFSATDYVVINANGSLTGQFGGTQTLGTWELRDGFWCRTITAGPRGAQPEDCQQFTRDGRTLNIVRERGTGSAFVYTIS